MGEGHQSFARDGRTRNQTRRHQLQCSIQCLWDGRQKVGEGRQSLATDGGMWNQTKCHNSAISACGMGAQWEKAINLLPEMAECGIKPDKISYISAISDCEKDGKWEKAVNLLREMAERGIKPDKINYNSAIRGLRAGQSMGEGQYPLARDGRPRNQKQADMPYPEKRPPGHGAG